MKALHKLITRIEPPNWVCGILAFVLLFRIPSFFEPYYYGDEMIYMTLGNAIRKGLTLYSQIHDNKPPLLYYTAAIAGNLFWFKAILAIWMLLTTIAFWHLTKELFKNSLSQKVSVIFFAIFTTIPLFEGNIVNAELFLIGPTIIALTILLSKPTYKNIFVAGVLFAVAALYKIPASFDVPVIIIYWFITLRQINFKNISEILRKTFVLGVGFAIPISITFVWYFFKGALGPYFTAAFLQNVFYISTWNGGASQSFVVKHGPLLIRAGIVVVGLIGLRVNSKRLSRPFLIASIWLLTSLFAATLSERPYPHYMIQAIPSISILVGILVTSVKFEQVLTIIPLTIALFVPVYYKFYYYSTSSYYVRFVEFASGSISKWDYFNTFDKYTQDNYEVSQFITRFSMPDDKVFVWGDQAPIVYALSRRLPPIKYVAAYHITDFSSKAEVVREFGVNPPDVIVVPDNSQPFPELTKFVDHGYISIYNQNNFTVWKFIAH